MDGPKDSCRASPKRDLSRFPRSIGKASHGSHKNFYRGSTGNMGNSCHFLGHQYSCEHFLMIF